MVAADCDQKRGLARVEMYSALEHMATAPDLLGEAGDILAWADAVVARVAIRDVITGMLDREMGRIKEALE